MLAAFIATGLFSVSIFCGHRAAKLAGGVEANFWRLSIAVLLLGIWSFTFGIGLGGEALPWFLGSGLIGFGLGDGALFQALPKLGAPLSSLFTQCLAPPIAALVGWVWLDTHLNTQQWVAIVAILAGVGVALAPAKTANPHLERVTFPGVFWGVLSAAGTGSGAVMSRKAFDVAENAGERIDGGNAAFQRIFAGLLVAGVTLVVVRWRQHGFSTRPQDLPPADVAVKKWRKLGPWVLGNALAGSTIGVSFMQWALSTTHPAIVLAIIATTPLAVIPLARIFEGERITKRSLAGSMIAVAGVAGLALAK